MSLWLILILIPIFLVYLRIGWMIKQVHKKERYYKLIRDITPRWKTWAMELSIVFLWLPIFLWTWLTKSPE